MPTAERVVAFLKDLRSKRADKKAREYVEKAPAQIATAYRKEIVRELGWGAGEPAQAV